MPPANGPAPLPPPVPDPNARLKAETERLKAEADRLKADADLEKARAERVKALGLPTFEGKTTLNQGAGAIEALILASDAIDDAAKRIADVARCVNPSAVFLILAGDEPIDFSQPTAIRAELNAFAAIFRRWLPAADDQRSLLADGIATPIAAITAIAGLLRTDTQVTAVNHDAISHRVLATAVAGWLAGRAILPGAVAAGSASDSGVIGALMALTLHRDKLASLADALPTDQAEVLNAALLRFDSFFTRVTAADAAGKVAIVQAARLEQMLDQNPLVVRIFVEKAGGSLIHRSNIWTFFGLDPVRVSGGLVASFTITNPTSGHVYAAEVLNCRTTLASLRNIQAGAPTRDQRRLVRRVATTGSARLRDDRHAVRPASLSTLLEAAGAGAVANYFNLAGEAIEAIVINAQPEAQYTWPDDVPKTSWGMTEVAWEGMLDEIKVEFGQRIAPVQFDQDDPFDGSWSKELSDLQWRLAQSVTP